MNNSKYNFEQEIQQQLVEREIRPTRDLWTEIANQTENKVPKKSRVSIYFLAACLVLIGGLGIILFFNSNKVAQSPIAEKGSKPTNSASEYVNQKQVPPQFIEKIEADNSNESRKVASQKLEISQPENLNEKKILPVVKENSKTFAIENTTLPAINGLAILDTATISKKKKKYVDASTLLFSVEHKDVIEKTKEGSNVATIDLNTK